MKKNFSIPEPVRAVSEALEQAGFEAYLVGGCVRDLMLGRTPKDWDIATNATPEDIQTVFPDSFYENAFGTVGVKTGSEEPSLAVVEVTPYRTEGKYSDARRPDSVAWAQTLSEDLGRRDFSVNALAYSPSKGALVDEHGGAEDLNKKLIKAVGNAEERFAEDALRMMRAIRLAAELGFVIDAETTDAIYKNAALLGKISKERIRDELVRILESDAPIEALFLAQRLELLKHIAPDLIRGIGVAQNQAHKFDVFEHLLRTMQHAADEKWDFDIRLAGLFHDVSKPETRRWSDEKKDWTFHGHEVVGAKVTRKALQELRFPKEKIERIVKLVRWHMFFSDPDKVTLSAVRRVIANVGRENIHDLLHLRICDRIGTGRPKAQPFRLRKYMAMVDQALRDPISVTMLALDGTRYMELTGERPSRRIGDVLHALLEEVLDEPAKNTKAYLEKRALELSKLDDAALAEVGLAGKERREREEEEAIQEIQAKHRVS
jgi:putative nucleotidyltransferase with HDIG domain